MKISNLYIGVIERIYKTDFFESIPVISSHPERLAVLYKENDSKFAEDLKYGEVYPIDPGKDSRIGESCVSGRSLTPMFLITEENKDEEIEKEKVLVLFNERYVRED